MYAEAAGLDSPAQIVGKTDDDMPWRKLADYFKAGDYGVLQGHTRLNSVETSDTINGITDILVSEQQLMNRGGKCIGIVGSFIDITGKKLIQKSGYYDCERDRFYIDSGDFKGVYFTGKELIVFKNLLLGRTAKQIAAVINISNKTVESYMDRIKLKLQVKSKSEIISIAINHGLTHILY